MSFNKSEILTVLDNCANKFTFPMLDNGYVYLAATRMSVFRSEADWAIIIEIFGYSPSAFIPDTHIYTFSNNLINRKSLKDFSNKEAYENYFKMNCYNESRFIYPIENEDWIDEDGEFLIEDCFFILRGERISLPNITEYSEFDIHLLENKVMPFEFSRFLAGKYRNNVLATQVEKVKNIPSNMKEILTLEDWFHPNLIIGELPSQNETFQQIADVIVHNDKSLYKPTLKPNTHWKYWPDGGSL